MAQLSTRGKLLLDAFCAAFAAFAIGLCLGHTWIQPSGLLYLAGIPLSCALLVFALIRTRRSSRRLAEYASDASAGKAAMQFLWSCVFFAMLSAMFGLAVSGLVWSAPDFLRSFGFYFWGAMTSIALYPVRRDAKRLAGAAGDPN